MADDEPTRMNASSAHELLEKFPALATYVRAKEADAWDSGYEYGFASARQIADVWDYDDDPNPFRLDDA